MSYTNSVLEKEITDCPVMDLIDAAMLDIIPCRIKNYCGRVFLIADNEYENAEYLR